MNQSQRIVIGLVVFVAAMFVWATFTNFGGWGWGTVSPHFWPHHHWSFAPFLALFIIFAMKRSRRCQRDRADHADYQDDPRRYR